MKNLTYLFIILILIAIADRSGGLAYLAFVGFGCSFVVWCVWQSLMIFVTPEPIAPAKQRAETLRDKLRALDVLNLDPITRRAAEQKIKREHGNS